MMNDIMIDLETVDNVASSAIVSIGAVECDIITGKTGEEFYRVVDLTDQAETGLTFNHDTISWWMEQSDSARQVFNDKRNRELPVDMCKSFIKWVDSLETNNEKIRVWGNGASFDNAILWHFLRRYGFTPPTRFWNDRDMRTLVGFYPYQLLQDWKIKNQRTGVYHNALDDAKYQVALCSNIMQELGVKEIY